MHQISLLTCKIGAVLPTFILSMFSILQAQTSIYEAEEALLDGPKIIKGRDAQGGAYVDFLNPSEDRIEWEVVVSQAGPYLLHFVYQLGGLEQSRDTYLLINGKTTGDSLMHFPNSGSWFAWEGINRTRVSLQEGSNTITLVAKGSSGPNIDYLSVSPQYLEAESAALDGVKVMSGRGASKTQYVDFQHPEGDRLIWEVEVPESGMYKLGFHYQLGYGLDRPLQMKVNERVINYNGAFPNTGSWADWSEIEYTTYLMSGQNTVELNAIGASGANFDYLEVSPAPFEEVSASTRYKINFSDEATEAPEGWIKDFGLPFNSALQTSSLTFGWTDLNTNEPTSLVDFGRNRIPSPDRDVLRETLQHFDHPSPSAPDAKWEIELPNGSYQVIVQCGDAGPETQAGTRHLIRVEGQTILDFPVNTGEFGVRNGTALVSVNDGRLTLDAVGGNNAKIQFVVIESTDGFTSPAVLLSNPPDGAQQVAPNTTISANFLHIPNISNSGASSLDNTTITENNVQLFEIAGAEDILIPSTVNGTGGGDAINLSPLSDLKPNTSYRLLIRNVRDLAGETLLPFSEVFVTGDAVEPPGSFLDQVAFEKFATSTDAENYTTLTMGPDGRMYGLTLFGNIYRWDIAPDGDLINQEILSGWKNQYPPRLAIGLCFDPNASADNLIAYVSHATQTALDGSEEGPEWDGKLSRISGANLQNEQLLVTNLPRSVRDHLTNSIAFRPGEPNALYFLQGSNSGGGGLEDGWGNRPERLLSGALLRLDLTKLPDDQALDARTSNDLKVINNARRDEPLLSDGTYNPYYSNAPLTIAASGVRNAYDLVWHSNGQAYIPTNGTGGGSESPSSKPGTRRPDGTFYDSQQIPAIGPNENQRDWLFRVDPKQPLGYYGHPNVTRGEYVLNRGPLDEADYPPFIQADVNFRGAAFDFQFNVSPNGVIEYQNPGNFNGALQGALLVCRYSGGSDVVILVPDGPNGDINTFRIGTTGLTRFKDPLDLAEDPSTGFLYVSDYGRREIILLKPVLTAGDQVGTASNTLISQSRVRIYPNPSESGERIRIEMRGPSEEVVRYRLYNLQGRMIWSSELPASQKQKFLELSSEEVMPGIYQLQIQGENWQETRKVLIRE